MNRPTTIAILLTAMSMLGSDALAQPALERVEGAIRKQVNQTKGAPAAAPKPTPIATEPGYLGVVADESSMPGAGIIVREVIAGGPAALAGLKPGDRITAINGRAAGRVSDMASVLNSLPAGTKVDFQVDRSGTTSTLVVTLSARPAADQRRFQDFGYIQDPAGPQPAGIQASGPRLGIRTLPLTAQDSVAIPDQVPPTAVRVIAVTPGSAAAQAGISTGALITAVDGQPVRSPEELGQLIRSRGASKPFDLTFFSGANKMRAQFTPVTAGPGASQTVVALQARGPAQLVSTPGAAVPSLTPAAPGPGPTPPPVTLTDAQRRVYALEQRLSDLEARIEKLEQAGAGRAVAPPAR